MKRRKRELRADQEHDSLAQRRVELAYERYAANIAAYAMRRTNRADAADAVAETFLVACRRKYDMPEEPATLPWLYGVARRVLANQYRSRNRRGHLHDRLRSQFVETAPGDDRLEHAERLNRAHRALAKLPTDDAEILRLAAWEDLSTTEIATAMDIAPDAARQRLHRARKRLRSKLEAMERSGTLPLNGHRSPIPPSPPAPTFADLAQPYWE